MNPPLAAYLCGKGGIFLNRTYDIISSGKRVGTAEVRRQGLYYTIDCFCAETFRPHSRITIELPSERIDLGLCIPLAGGFGMQTRIPVKRIGDHTPVFVLTQSQQVSVTFIPVDENKPFDYLSKLKDARFAIRGGKTGIEITQDQISISKPTGQ